MTRTRRKPQLAWAIAWIACAGACADRPLPLEPTRQDAEPAPAAPATEAQIRQALDDLNEWENATRSATDFTAEVSFERRSGSNPVALTATGDGRAAGVLRGSDEIVLLDAEARILSRAKAPPSPVDVARDGNTIYVAGAETSDIWTYQIDGNSIRRGAETIATGALEPAAIAAGGGRLFVADGASGETTMHRRPAASGPWSSATLGTAHGTIDLELTERHLVAVNSLDHQLRVWRIDGPRPLAYAAPIQHDGPLWKAAARDRGDGVVIAVTGIEDKPLDRSDQGSFGYIDSFAFVYEVSKDSSKRLASINVSEHRLITSKWLELELTGAPTLRLGSVGGDRALTLRWKTATFDGSPTIETREIPPGTTSIARLGEAAVLANPLLDGWLVDDGTSYRFVAAPGSDPRPIEPRIGELLFFTSLMAPWSESTDKRSRFTCEACHVDGYVDGRTHFTGRGDVIATSRPLRGLFNNRPHFTRALDETTTEMVNNEFGVANKLNGRSPWFELRAADFPWLAHVRGVPATMSPVQLRRSLMLFLRDFTHQRSPFTRGRKTYSADEAAGAALFRDRCEACHNARLVADDPTSQVPFEAWPAHIFERQGVIVWGRSGYEKTGVEPYVNPRGARPPTLRRLYRKWPYFTNGSAATIAKVLDQVRYDPAPDAATSGFRHAGKGRKALTAAERRALAAFLQIL